MRIRLIGIIFAALAGCTTTTTVDKEAKLLTLAAGEAQQIHNPQQRLTRQLNFASRQSARGQTDEARQSLAYAAQTLRDAKDGDLPSQLRIAGWVSISELSRGMKDQAAAKTACDQAVATLRTIGPITDRPDYVIGVAAEVQALSGKPEAAKLLEESAAWIKPMQPQTMQRVALVAVADAIFNDDDYDGGLTLLRTDSDATWRSDTLAMLAEQDQSAQREVMTAKNNVLPLLTSPSFIDPAEPMTRANSSGSFGKPVDFESVFQNKLGGSDAPATNP
jgi:hypothetical protein